VSAVAPASASLGRAAQPQPADATRLLYERHSGRIFGYCLSLLGSREEAEDAVQTTFLNAQRGLGRGVVPEFELAWLFKIARNVCNNRRVSASRQGRVESLRDFDTLQDALACPERGGDVSVGDLTRALAGIPERQRRALLLREWQGLSYDEIAAELGVSVAAVETLLFRARRSVAEQLEQAGTTTRRRGVAASVAELFRWLFTGGAVPLKVAAATATVAATLTLAVAPAVRDHGPVPASVSPQRSVPVVPRTDRLPVPVVRERVSPRPSRTAATKASSPPAASLPPSSPPAREVGPPRSSIPSGPANDLSGGSVTPPAAATVPSVTVATVTTPEVSLPELSLPQVQLPPLEVQPLPEPPKLTLP
jgi:RNA polymerase sigma-70 factor (ECF subfamily)